LNRPIAKPGLFLNRAIAKPGLFLNRSIANQGADFRFSILDEIVNDCNMKMKKHGTLFPNSVRCLVVGISAAGKTNLVITLLTHVNGLKFQNLYVYSKSLEQPKYDYLDKIFGCMKDQTFSNSSEVIPIDSVKPNSVFIFDDVITENQSMIRGFFCRSRHKGIDCVYLSQSYAKLLKHLLRENANFLILFRQDSLSLKHIFEDHVNPDMSYQKFLQLCKICWKDKHDFIVIAKDYPLNNGRYRKGFNTFIGVGSDDKPKSRS
jgi:hypothetical protein